MRGAEACREVPWSRPLPPSSALKARASRRRTTPSSLDARTLGGRAENKRVRRFRVQAMSAATDVRGGVTSPLGTESGEGKSGSITVPRTPSGSPSHIPTPDQGGGFGYEPPQRWSSVPPGPHWRWSGSAVDGSRRPRPPRAISSTRLNMFCRVLATESPRWA